MATVQTLKDKDNNTFYPVTKTEAVYNADGSKTLDYILDHTIIASEDPADANKVFKGNASLGLVTSDNIDFTTFADDPISISDMSPIAGISDFSSSFQASCHKNKAGICQLYLYIKNTGNSTISSFTTILTLPEGYRPGARVHVDNPSIVEIQYNGAVQLGTALASGNGILTSICYLNA